LNRTFGCTARENHFNLETDQISGEIRDAIWVSARPAPLNNDILSLNITELMQSFLECLVVRPRRGARHQITYPRGFRRLLRLSHSRNHHEHESDYRKPQPFSILDFEFSIIGIKSRESIPKSFVHAFLQLKIAN